MNSSTDLNEILIFASVVRTGSFTRAARELAMPKSTVSRKLRELEDRLGARLLQRTTRKLSLTDVGETYYRHCERVIAEVEEGERAVSRLQETPRGRLRVTTPVSFSFFGPVVAEFLKRYPEVEMEMVCTDRVVDMIQEGFDVAIRAGRLSDSGLIARSLGAIRWFVVASPSYLERCGTPRAPEDLARHEGVRFSPAGVVAGWRLVSGSRSVHVDIPARLVVNDLDMLCEAALAGLGIALIPAHRCINELRARRLVRVLEEWSSAEAPLHAVYPSTRHLSPKVVAFLDHLREHLREPIEELAVRR